jgi:hypothetical protein
MLTLGSGSTYEVEMVAPVGSPLGAGAVVGIRPISNGAGQYNNYIPYPQTTGGSGSGVQLGYSRWGQVGPSSSYAFPDYVPNVGTVTSYYLVSGGSGYKSGSTLTFVEIPAASSSLQILTTSLIGTILTYNQVTSSRGYAIPTSICNLHATASDGSGAGAVYGGLFVLNKKPTWLTELNRLRNNIATVNTPYHNYIQNSVSGPWPISGPQVFYKNQAFYFADTGTQVSLSLSSVLTSFTIPLTKYVWRYWPVYYSAFTDTPTLVGYYGGGEDGYKQMGTAYSHIEYQLVVGGSSSLMVNGCLYTLVSYADGYSVSTNNNTHVNTYTYAGGHVTDCTVTSDFPVPFKWDNSGYLYAQINQLVNPGTYTLQIDVPAAGALYVHHDVDTDTSEMNSEWSFQGAMQSGGVSSINGSGNFSAHGAFSVTSSVNAGAALVPGIHSSKNVFKLTLGGDIQGNNALIGINGYVDNTADDTGTYPQQTDWRSTPFTKMLPWTLSALPTGSWVGIIPPINNLNVPAAAQMPWNLPRTQYGSSGNAIVNPSLFGNLAPNIANVAQVSNAYSQSVTVETQLELPAWVANRYFTKGISIMDCNGNLQIVTTAGVTGGSQPSWTPLENEATTDGSVTWKCRRILSSTTPWATGTKMQGQACRDSNGNTQVALAFGSSGTSQPDWKKLVGQHTTDGTVTWEMRAPIQPTQHRNGTIPVYPYYWNTETNPYWKTPTTSSGLTRWGAYDQWMRNNYNTTKSYDTGWQQDNLALGWWIYSVSLNRMVQSPSSQVSATVGCMRNGSFTAFGSYNTGQTIQVLWPVFTSDALCYTCSERIEICATAINCQGTNGVSIGSTIPSGIPIAAAFINDISASFFLTT